jgi:hypothetical protein
MSEPFLQRLFQKLGGRAPVIPRPPAKILAGVFGKHPVWDDHIPDLGINHPALVALKETIYEGIAGNVDSGQWEKLAQTGNIQPWGHTLFQSSPAGVIAGRLWYSKDGKGRDRYPMAAVLLWPKAPARSELTDMAQRLCQTQAQCEAAMTVDAVSRAVEDLRSFAADRAAVAGVSDRQTGFDLADCNQLGPDRQGLLRVIYHLERELPIGFGNARMTSIPRKSTAAASARTPRCAPSGAFAAEAWLSFLGEIPSMPAPRLAIAPDVGNWIDVIIGKPGVSQLFCLRAPPDALPLTNEIPYSLDASFIDRALRVLGRHGSSR